jgi:drug/metabolite transporter (DMT)-like permease
VAGQRAARHRPAAAWPATGVAVLAGLAAVSLAATLPLSLLSRQIGNGVVAAVIGLPCAAVGVVVARRLPRNPLGWLFLLTAVCLFVSNDGGDYS